MLTANSKKREPQSREENGGGRDKEHKGNDQHVPAWLDASLACTAIVSQARGFGG